jgi:hypothetical protein
MIELPATDMTTQRQAVLRSHLKSANVHFELARNAARFYRSDRFTVLAARPGNRRRMVALALNRMAMERRYMAAVYTELRQCPGCRETPGYHWTTNPCPQCDGTGRIQPPTQEQR